MPCSIPYAPHLTTVPAPDHILLPNSQTPLAVGALPDPRSKCLEGIACPELPRADKLTRGAPGAPHEREVVWSRAREDRVRTVPFYTPPGDIWSRRRLKPTCCTTRHEQQQAWQRTPADDTMAIL